MLLHSIGKFFGALLVLGGAFLLFVNLNTGAPILIRGLEPSKVLMIIGGCFSIFGVMTYCVCDNKLLLIIGSKDDHAVRKDNKGIIFFSTFIMLIFLFYVFVMS
ncbi:MAG: hypothetical protein COA79_21715 [Planctomycetota bacterium]|nr:MAG: hypothetical protein COA79_21715 [Planctomycetota bacterium]